MLLCIVAVFPLESYPLVGFDWLTKLLALNHPMLSVASSHLMQWWCLWLFNHNP